MRRLTHLLTWSFFLLFACAASQRATKGPQGSKDEGPMSTGTFDGLALRSIGPALMSGRIADIAVPPGDPNVWYVAVGSGGVWKTENAGTTWQSMFDGQASYSVGCVTVDPSNPHVVWVGTGENVGGRHVGYGDGVYRSRDGGKSWENLGLKQSEHISKIIVHPEDSETVWVAVQGPLWSSGGERGLYKTTDGGGTWRQVLSAGPWTGVTDLAIDPRDPKVLYAATWQRHRTVAGYVGGGPESGLHKSEDGGETWRRLTKGLPGDPKRTHEPEKKGLRPPSKPIDDGNMGKIGLAISPQNPDVLYAAIEVNLRKGAVFRSTDRGASWEKRSDTVSGGTGPHYYQELYASPHAEGRIYLADVRIQVSDDGGKTFRSLTEKFKHSDNHALVFRSDDPDYLLVGTDGGLYESFDLAKNWRFVDNLPVTQFYKVAVDDAVPFYNVYGGTQDNNTQGGPSRTDSASGIRNADWRIMLGGDGHQPATEPGNPNIMYAEWQQGNLVRVDTTTGERVYIKPQAAPGDPPDRFNWDSPILVSPHSPTRLYFASQRLWRSDNRGDSWTAISGDLTRNEERLLIPHMDRKWSFDSPWDLWAMSEYNTITSVAESPRQPGLLYVGTDDGLIQVTDDGGKNWRKIEVGKLPGVPKRAFVNDIKADLFDADTVYVALDNHKYGDFGPYLLMSNNRGRSWRSIAGDLPDRHLVWRVVQDHVRKELLFAGTEFGVFFTVDGGRQWIKLAGAAPTIPFRDLAIQRRENDLVGASFGRGFWILDDYTPLRFVDQKALSQPAMLFSPRRAYWYIERRDLGSSRNKKAAQGEGFYTADNPPFGAVLTYYLKDGLRTRTIKRREQEIERMKLGKDTPFTSWDDMEAEAREPEPAIILTVRDDQGQVVRRLYGPTSPGMHRVAWDLRLPARTALGLKSDYKYAEDHEPRGVMVGPGRYTVTLSKREDGKTVDLTGAVDLDVVPLRQGGALPGADPKTVAAFWKRVATLARSVSAASVALKQTKARLDRLEQALDRSRSAPDGLDAELDQLRHTLADLREELRGNPAKGMMAAAEPRTVRARLDFVAEGTLDSTYGPNPAHIQNMELAEQGFQEIRERLNRLLTEQLPAFESRLQQAGAPWAPGQPIP
ncbi:MAG: glycosyl hydrolase [Myxococcales bacterium FL481]|nr:MAG: glycosyl hydrolase [Myxococcales bacterium FL481]